MATAPSLAGSLGERLRARRDELGLSLRELADMTNLTASFISKVERGLVDPSITSLRALAQALKVPVFYLLLENEHADRVVRRDQRRKLVYPGVTYELLTPDLERGLEVLMARLAPGAASSEQPMTHPTEECIVVLEGAMRLELGPDVYDLDTGDSIYYDGSIPHRVIARGERDLVFLSCLTPAGF